MTKKPELLAPAGSPEALSAAIEAGADAVYFGGALFSNRMRAKNFTADELCSAISLSASYGVKSYITMNTRLRDREMADAVSMAKELYSAGATAFIVADTGLAMALKNTLPSVELHASTQATGVNTLDAEALRELGFSRMVCPRELSMGELCRLVEESPIEIEMFIHGAHCVSVSGQCLMSWAMGGRSGNRGECAQPCRLPYKLSCGRVKTGYPLSLKDMCLARHVPEIISSGVSSLKIEGRLKSPDYVYGVTKIYRTLLDEGRGATDAEVAALDAIFSRDGFTDGYFKNRFSHMTGMRGEGTPSAGEKFTSLSRKVPVTACLKLKVDEAASLELSDGQDTVQVSGAVAQTARSAPISADAAYKSISKLGTTLYSLSREDFSCETSGDVFMTASQINELRRLAVEKLEAAKKEKIERRDAVNYEAPSFDGGPVQRLKTAEFFRAENIPASAWDYFDVVFLPQGEMVKVQKNKTAQKLGLNLPPWCADSEKIKKSLGRFAEDGGKYVLCHTSGQLKAARDAGLIPIASFRANVTSKAAADGNVKLGAEYVTLSPELKLPAVADICRSIPSAGAVVYGKLPLMLLRRCIMSDAGCSGKCGGDGCLLPSVLSDRRGASFAVVPTGERTNVVLNSVPIYAADKMDSLAGAGIVHFIFTDESEAEVKNIIYAYSNSFTPDEAGISAIKRI